MPTNPFEAVGHARWVLVVECYAERVAQLEGKLEDHFARLEHLAKTTCAKREDEALGVEVVAPALLEEITRDRFVLPHELRAVRRVVQLVAVALSRTGVITSALVSVYADWIRDALLDQPVHVHGTGRPRGRKPKAAIGEAA